MSVLLDLIAPYWQQIVGGLAFIVGFVGVYFKGRSDQKARAKLEDLSNANQIRRDGATARAGADPDRLRDDGWRRD